MFWFQILECVLLLASFITCDSKLNKVRVQKKTFGHHCCAGELVAHIFSPFSFLDTGKPKYFHTSDFKLTGASSNLTNFVL